MKLKMKLLSVYSEHAFVQNPVLGMPASMPTVISLVNSLKALGIKMYFNHFVLAVEDDSGLPMYMGFNDNYIHFGYEFHRMSNSKEVWCNYDGVSLEIDIDFPERKVTPEELCEIENHLHLWRAEREEEILQHSKLI